MRTRQLFLTLALLLTAVTGAWADNWDVVYRLTQTTSANWAALGSGSTTGRTLGSAGNTTYYYATGNLSFTNSTAGGSGLTIQGTVYLYIPTGVTVTCTGHNASGTTGAGAGIELTAGNTLNIIGSGTLNATGGNAANGGNGANGGDSFLDYDNNKLYSGTGGTGGNGGGGAGAGIGTRGGNGGTGGTGGERHTREGSGSWDPANGNNGSAGTAGTTAGAMGNLYVVTSFVHLSATGGQAGSNGNGGNSGWSALWDGANNWSAPGGGGGGAGGFGGTASNIGTGGPGGGGGGGGAGGCLDWKGSGYYYHNAVGGSGGTNANGSSAPDGQTAEVSPTALANGKCGTNGSFGSDAVSYESNHASNGSGGAGGAQGGNSVNGTINNIVGIDADGFYIIGSAADWDTFSAMVSGGNDFNGKTVKLTADISVTTKCGTVSGSTQENPFSGTFDGNGHTITATISDNDNQGTALFCYINGATIKNLKVAGTISSSQYYAAGLVGFADGTCTIEGCVVTANVNGSQYVGGIVGHALDSVISLRGCVFSGLMTGGNVFQGTFIGWNNSSTRNVDYCLYIMADGQNTTNLYLVNEGDNLTMPHCYKTTSEGSQGLRVEVLTPNYLGSLAHDYGLVKVYTNTSIYYDGKYYMDPNQTLSGDGTETNPITISSADDWNHFANNVNNGNSFSGQFVKLMNDIEVTKKCGTVSGSTQVNPFSGTFDGTEHTITAKITDNDNQGTAPFCYINDATIKNLKVTGTIASNKYHTSGLVGFADGTNLIENCIVNATLNISSYYAGGIIGHGLTSTTTVKNCIFAGTINGVGGKRGNIGGIWGWSTSGTPTLLDCLEKGTYTNIASMHPMGLQGGSGTITNCYYVNAQIGSPSNASSVDGAIHVSATVPADEVYGVAKLIDNNDYYVLYKIDGVEAKYDFRDIFSTSISITPALKATKGVSLTFGTDFTAKLDDVAVEELPISITNRGTYTLTLTGTGTYAGSKSVSIFVDGKLTGDGSEPVPYLIENDHDWEIFADYVNHGTNYSGEYVKLTADINVSKMAGASDANSFQGTFDGDGHTLTFTKGTAESPFEEQYCAPFRYINGAVIHDLSVDGTIYTKLWNAAGIVGYAEGNNSITNCHVGIAIIGSYNGRGIHGGLVARIERGAFTISNCVFDGSMTYNAYSPISWGGFVGLTEGIGQASVSFSNCIFAPSNLKVNTYDSATFSRGKGSDTKNITLTNCYYTEALGDAQGKQAYALASAPANLGNLVQDYGTLTAYENGILYDGTYYVAPATVTLADNADNSTTISNNGGYVADVTLQGRTLYKDGSWNTLCLPFSVDNFTGTPLEGATVKTLASTGFSGGTLTMNFTDDVTSIEAGTPYIVMWAKPDGYTVDGGYDISEPVFNGITISNVTANAETDYVDFVGTYGPVSIYTAGKTNLYLGAGNKLYYPTASDFTVNAFRGYFQLKQSLTVGEAANGVRAFVLNFGDDETTGIISVYDSEFTVNGSDAWYSLDGRRLSGKPTQRGIYINNGRKVVIK